MPEEYPQTAQGQGCAVLAVSQFPGDHTLLADIFRNTNWKLHAAAGCREARRLLEKYPINVIVCDETLSDGAWWNLLDNRPNIRPSVPARVIVASRLADDLLWSSVLNLGGFDVLAKPFEPAEVTRVVAQACRHWKSDFDRAPRPSKSAFCGAAG